MVAPTRSSPIRMLVEESSRCASVVRVRVRVRVLVLLVLLLCMMVLSCVVLCRVVWCGVVWCGVVWCVHSTSTRTRTRTRTTGTNTTFQETDEWIGVLRFNLFFLPSFLASFPSLLLGTKPNKYGIQHERVRVRGSYEYEVRTSTSTIRTIVHSCHVFYRTRTIGDAIRTHRRAKIASRRIASHILLP